MTFSRGKHSSSPPKSSTFNPLSPLSLSLSSVLISNHKHTTLSPLTPELFKHQIKFIFLAFPVVVSFVIPHTALADFFFRFLVPSCSDSRLAVFFFYSRWALCTNCTRGLVDLWSEKRGKLWSANGAPSLFIKSSIVLFTTIKRVLAGSTQQQTFAGRNKKTFLKVGVIRVGSWELSWWLKFDSEKRKSVKVVQLTCDIVLEGNWILLWSFHSSR